MVVFFCFDSWDEYGVNAYAYDVHGVVLACLLVLCLIFGYSTHQQRCVFGDLFPGFGVGLEWVLVQRRYLKISAGWMTGVRFTYIHDTWPQAGLQLDCFWWKRRMSVHAVCVRTHINAEMRIHSRCWAVGAAGLLFHVPVPSL